MLPGDLDVSGWELRKTLRLFAKSNLALNEWIGSPIVYSSEASFHERLTALLPGYFNPIAGMYHYRRMAQAALEDNLGTSGIGIKKLFYVMRPLLACRWIVNAKSQPPTEFSRLVAAAWVTGDEKRWIADLLRQKAVSAEAQSIELEPWRVAQLRAEIASVELAASGLPAPEKARDDSLDALLRAWIR
jgi:predicted nucleotidyltransferase